MNDVTLYSAGQVFPVTAPPIAEGAVAVQNGRILHVGERAWVRRSLSDRGIVPHEVHWPGVLIPGLVNAHSHLQYTGMAEVGQGRYHGFEDWARAFDPVYERGRDWAADAADGAARLIRTGTTAVADVVTDVDAASALHDARLHGITYWEVMSWTNADWARTGRRQVEDALDALPTPPGTGLSPHAPYSLDIEPLLEIPDIVRERGGRIHIHLGEAAFESEFAHDQAHAWHTAGLASFQELRDAGFGTSATEFVDQLGVLGPDCHIAHGVYMSARDRAILRERHTSVALCPRSNAVIGLEEPPIAAYLREGNPIAVGTDSLSSSPSLDLLADVAELARIARAQGYTDRDLHARLLNAATLGGAHAMGIDVGPDRTGYLAVGALADLAFFDVEPGEDAVVELVEHGAGRAAATVIAGEVRHSTAAFETPPSPRGDAS
ncbi:amidohydrolase family protein [Microbacterium azadirachtae]|uniref:amidohydrolase family protein n=1 Tax=Microbacterium azadirachtae TaxID=582680 RepID=UPI0008865487|nr:amidohydrolase family protein [Microbacterium azadirachtae]SDL25582.1 Cytosine/adenosine deaminase [Microbacterium azadirachtae]SEF55482.1 Cytosine/adenosine deaminase [Microbacterium azadirachtae]SEF55810.1 Cytosine/adenosine deaminase [Microbacterium azadirachtae]